MAIDSGKIVVLLQLITKQGLRQASVTTVRLLRRRQTKGAVTDRFNLQAHDTYFLLYPKTLDKARRFSLCSNRGIIRLIFTGKVIIVNMPKEATVKSRISYELKNEVDQVLSSLGMTSSEAIRLFYKQMAMRQELPLELKVPNEVTANALNAPLLDSVYMDADELFDDVLNEKP